MGCIYKITNKINSKSYIGLTINSCEVRWKQHKADAKYNRYNFPLHKAINKYGIDNFSVEVIATENDINKLCELEISFINLCDSINNGYNLMPGGQGVYHNKDTGNNISKGKTGSKHSEITKARISTSHKGIPRSEECKEKMRKTMKLVSHCKRGHEFNEANTYINKQNGRRSCKICSYESCKLRRSKAKHV